MIKPGIENIALAYIKATVALAHSQGRLRSLADRACMGRTLIEQSPRLYSHRDGIQEIRVCKSVFVVAQYGLTQVANSHMHLRLKTIKL